MFLTRVAGPHAGRGRGGHACRVHGEGRPLTLRVPRRGGAGDPFGRATSTHGRRSRRADTGRPLRVASGSRFGCNAPPDAHGRSRRRAPPVRLRVGRPVRAAAVRLRRGRRPAADHARGPAAGDEPGDAGPPRPAPADQRRPAVAGAAAAAALVRHGGHGGQPGTSTACGSSGCRRPGWARSPSCCATWIGGRAFGRTAGVLSGLALATGLEFYAYATVAEDDVYLAALVAVAMALFVRGPARTARAAAPLGRRAWPVWAFFAVAGLSNWAKGPLLGWPTSGRPWARACCGTGSSGGGGAGWAGSPGRGACC